MLEASRAPSLRFTPEDVQLFSTASHDRNPLHLSEVYARKTPYGQPVVFGVLAALGCLGRLGARRGRTLSNVELEFRMPVFADVDYAVIRHETSSEQVELSVLDGSQLIMRVIARFQEGEPDLAPAVESVASTDSQSESLDRNVEDLAAGVQVAAPYAPDWTRVGQLMEQFHLPESGVGASQVAALLWSSYLVGMQLPGRRALFVRLSLRFEPGRVRTGQPLAFLATVRTMDRRSRLMTADVRLTVAGAPLAAGEISALVRQDVPAPTLQAVESLQPGSALLSGKLGLVIGASRGLGAALALSLASQGCTVLASFRRSEVEAEQLQASAAAASGTIRLLRGDAAELAWCEEVREIVVGEYGRLDYLICNAAPALLPMRLHARTVDRLNAYLTRSVGLVSVPMAVFLPLVSEHAGWLVTISSSAVAAPPADWPHYVSAKYAIEGLTRVAALEQRAASYLIARPPRLRTDLLNTPLGHEGATAPERVAAHIVAHLMGPPAPGRVQVLEDLS
jgi:NAD(P)-dependent dehydrogenase (short-subunit alcohol dehydrogenase family)/acyl dehydratase